MDLIQFIFTYVSLLVVLVGFLSFLREKAAAVNGKRLLYNTLVFVAFLAMLAVFLKAMVTMSDAIAYWLHFKLGSPEFLLVAMLVSVPIAMASISHGKIYVRFTNWLAAKMGVVV